jgi:hypothetical protein
MPFPVFTLPAPPKIQAGREIYDSIMRQIEPELISSALPTLNMKHQYETAEEKRARGERYRKSFIKYYEAFEVYVADMRDRIHRYQHGAMKTVEEASRWEEGMALDNLSASMFSLA